MSDGERACLVPSKEAKSLIKLEVRQNFNTKVLFIPGSLKLLQALELGGQFDSELEINT